MRPAYNRFVGIKVKVYAYIKMSGMIAKGKKKLKSVFEDEVKYKCYKNGLCNSI